MCRPTRITWRTARTTSTGRRANVPKDLENINHPVLIVAAWFDAQDFYGPFRMYRAMKEKNPANKTSLVVGPWLHGGWARGDGSSLGRIEFGSKTAEHFRTTIELPFFNFYLKDKGRLNLGEAIVFETGGNRWHTYPAWPPKGTRARNVYLQANGGLSFDAPSVRSDDAFDDYVSDPAKPVPYTAEITTTEGHLFMVEDQRFVWGRPDVLVYQTPPLTEDLTIAGPIDVNLTVSTTGTDGDWVAKVIDVYPGNLPAPMGHFQMLLAADILRAKFRNSMSAPEPMTPDQPTKLAFTLGDKYQHVPQGAPRDGADSELVVPDVRSQSADLRGRVSREAGGLSQGDAQSVAVGVAAVVRHAAGAARPVAERSHRKQKAPEIPPNWWIPRNAGDVRLR